MNIRKSAEPKEWTKYKNIPGVQFSGIPALQESLYREQGYLGERWGLYGAGLL
nr:hypothetical protein [Prevotella sp.]